jgi:RNAse (barnase) inhibitor barstar
VSSFFPEVTTLSQPYLLSNGSEPARAYEFAWKLSSHNIEARILRGSKMTAVENLFDEVSAVLQFPDYFGENWAAFDECLCDLSWLPASAYVLIVTRAEKVLTGDQNGQLPVFLKTLKKAAEEWATPVDLGENWDRDAIPFHVVFQFEGGLPPANWIKDGQHSNFGHLSL